MERLRVSPDGRHLESVSGEPFFWLADTAWTIAGELRWKDARDYMANRREKGFTVLQIVALDPEVDAEMRSPVGEPALIDNDPLRPNERYFSYLDQLIEMAAAHELHVLLLPAWGQLVVGDNWFGGVFEKLFDEEKAFAYGRWIGGRYGRHPHVLWALGGDRHPVHRGVDYRPVWRRMAEGIASGALGRELRWNVPDPGWAELMMTYHAAYAVEDGKCSTTSWWTDEDAWISFNMLQSGHNSGVRSYARIAEDYGRTPVKPVFDGEPNYEEMPSGFSPTAPLHGAWAVRRRAWWAMLAGAFGHTYGHACIWSMVDESRRNPHLPSTWREAMDKPGAWQMKGLKDLFVSRPWWRLTPCPEMIGHADSCGADCIADHRQAAVDREGRFAIVYLTAGGTETVDLGRLEATVVHAWWFDPRTGECRNADGTASTEPFARIEVAALPAMGAEQARDRREPVGTATETLPDAMFGKSGIPAVFSTPTRGDEQDWVLVLDDADAGFGRPGRPIEIIDHTPVDDFLLFFQAVDEKKEATHG